MDRLGRIFNFWRMGFGKVAEAAPAGSAVQKLAQDGEATSGVLLDLLGGEEADGDKQTITTTGEVADEGGS